MKYLLPILIALIPFVKKAPTATIYYVSSSGNDANNGTSTATPWKTIAKVNSVWAAGTFAPGDQILFKRGDTWTGETIVPTESGTSGNHIFIGAYSTGTSNPIISGFTTVTSWTSLGSNLYVTTSEITSSSTYRPNIVAINGVPYAKGRYPNANASNKGHLTIDSHTGQTVLVDAALPSSPDWDGAQAVLRMQRWFNDTVTIASHSGTTVTLARNATSELRNGWGYFQHSISMASGTTTLLQENARST
jgi:hypothetical protein